MSIRDYKNGKKDGEWKEYNELGNLTMHYIYINGEEI